MELTSDRCRAQEAIQLERAKSEPLENVRIVAQRAAVAWAYEAKAAERREARKLRKRAIDELARVQNRQPEDNDSPLLSENPDRGFASD